MNVLTYESVINTVLSVLIIFVSENGTRLLTSSRSALNWTVSYFGYATGQNFGVYFKFVKQQYLAETFKMATV